MDTYNVWILIIVAVKDFYKKLLFPAELTKIIVFRRQGLGEKEVFRRAMNSQV